MAAAIIIPNILVTIIEEPIGHAENIILGANKPVFVTTFNIIANFVGIGLTYLYLFVLKIPEKFGIQGIIWLIPLAGLPIELTKFVLFWRYIDKHIAPVQIKKFGWQAFIAPLVPSLALAGWRTLGNVCFSRIGHRL